MLRYAVIFFVIALIAALHDRMVVLLRATRVQSRIPAQRSRTSTPDPRPR